MENKISLEASGMPGVIKTMEKHFGRLIQEASTVKAVSTSAIVGAPDKGREPPFKPIQGPIDPLNPFQNLESSDLWGTYVTRDDRDIEVVVEIKSFRPPDGIDRCWAGEQMDGGEVELGDAWTLRGSCIELSPEERERIERAILP